MTLRQEVSNELKSRGFRRKGRMHLLPIDKQFSYWVDIGPIETQSDIAPFVGIRHDQVEKLFGEFLGVPKDNWVGTIGANVGYVLGEGYRWWKPPSKAEEVIDKILLAFERYKPFLSLERIIDAWEVAGIDDPDRSYREIVILIMQGHYEDALKKLEAARNMFCKQENEICDQFKGFERRSLAYMKSAIKDEPRWGDTHDA